MQQQIPCAGQLAASHTVLGAGPAVFTAAAARSEWEGGRASSLQCSAGIDSGPNFQRLELPGKAGPNLNSNLHGC